MVLCEENMSGCSQLFELTFGFSEKCKEVGGDWNNIKGFTLVEVIVVIAIVGIFEGIAMPSVV